MSDLIERQAVEDAIYDYSRSCDVNYAQIMEYIDKIPSVSTEKTGRWIFDEKIDKHYYCSECKAMGVDYFDYCPYCGARMREVVDESVDESVDECKREKLEAEERGY